MLKQGGTGKEEGILERSPRKQRMEISRKKTDYMELDKENQGEEQAVERRIN